MYQIIQKIYEKNNKILKEGVKKVLNGEDVSSLTSAIKDFTDILGKELFSEIFFECCPFCSTVPYSEKAFEFSSSLTQEKPPEYPRGLFLCTENVRQAVSQRLYSPGADTAAYLPHHRCSAYLFICQGGAAGRPLIFEDRWSSGRGGERPSSEGSPSPIPYPFPCPTRRIRLP